MSALGIFWFVGDVLVAAGCAVEQAARYGDCLTYVGGHADHWERWQKAGGRWLSEHGLPVAILSTEYDAHPRGRIVKEPSAFIVYADPRLQKPAYIAAIKLRFDLHREKVLVRSDEHYRRHSSDLPP